MEPSNWAPEHSDALRECFALRLSCSEAATAINRKFKTSYSRNAVLSRATRMGLAGRKPREPLSQLTTPPVLPRLNRLGETRPAEPRLSRLIWPVPACGKSKAPKLRSVEIDPRHISMVDLEREDCRYPYGGDEADEAITFCGHPRRPGSSYCTPHFHLSRGPGSVLERAAHIVPLRVIEAG